MGQGQTNQSDNKIIWGSKEDCRVAGANINYEAVVAHGRQTISHVSQGAIAVICELKYRKFQIYLN